VDPFPAAAGVASRLGNAREKALTVNAGQGDRHRAVRPISSSAEQTASGWCGTGSDMVGAGMLAGTFSP
jgi:hypothetical protein